MPRAALQAPPPACSARAELPMYKLKDWPPKTSFAQRMVRHNEDFLEALARCASLALC